MSYDDWKLRAPEDELTAFDRPLPSSTKVKVCMECSGIATHFLKGDPLCFDHYRDQSEALIAELAASEGDDCDNALDTEREDG